MLYMNDYDLDYAKRRFTYTTKPNRLALVFVVDNLRNETNQVSDGWAYWTPPVKAAKNAMLLIQSTTWEENEKQEGTDITEAEMLAAVRPIKSFLTRHAHVYSAERRERILRAVND